jgi:hypothetical protein
MMKGVQVDKLLNALVKNYDKLNILAKDDMNHAWEEAKFVGVPKIDLDGNRWTYNDVEGIVDWRMIFEWQDIKVTILSYLVEYGARPFDMKIFFGLSLGCFSIEPWVLMYDDRTAFPAYKDDLVRLKCSELAKKFASKIPILTLDIVDPTVAYLGNHYGHRTEDEAKKAIKNYCGGDHQDTYFRLVPRDKYTCDEDTEILCQFEERAPIDLGSSLDTPLGKYYLIYQKPNPIMWDKYKKGLIAKGLPKSYADRISQVQQNRLTNFGHMLKPHYSCMDKWELLFGRLDHYGKLELKLEPIELDQPARKRRCGPLRQLHRHELALREISPSYYFRFPEIIDLPKKSVRAPKWVTRRDTPIEHGFLDVLWTGRAYFKRTWYYETTSGFIAEGKMSQRRYNNRRQWCTGKCGARVNPVKVPTQIKKIFYV